MLPLLVSASHAARLEPPLREKALAASIAVATLTSTPAVADAAPREGGGAGGGGGGGGGEAGGTGGGALLREAAEEMVSEHVPLRTKGLVTIRNLLHRREGCVMSQLDLIVGLCEAQLRHPESFVYQAALNALEAAAAAEPSLVLPRIAGLLMPDAAHSAAARPAAPPPPAPLSIDGLLRARAADSGDHGGGGGERERDGAGGEGEGEGDEGDGELDEAAERRLKAAQAICQAVRRLGETLPPHAEAVMGALLVGSCDAHPAVRASCLGCLADVASTLRFALHPWAVELLQVGAPTTCTCT